MSELKRTQLYDVHVAAGASMVDFGGWEMPIQYPSGIVAEHLYTRHACSLFDVSHMGRVLVEGPDRVAFLQHVLSSNVESLDLNMAQYCIIPTENGSAVDDAYLYRFEEERFLLVVNAANTEKDLAHLREAMKNYNCTMTEITKDWAAIAVQGPKCKDILMTLSGGRQLTPENVKNALSSLTMEGKPVRIIRNAETNLGDLCADAYRYVSGADIAFVNGGGIRVSIKEGDITLNDILKVHPFGNALCVCEATGQQILDALEFGAKDVPGEFGGFLQVSGLTYEIHTYLPSTVKMDEKRMFVGVEGEYRVKNVMVGGEPLDLEKIYTLASHNYMLQGQGDGYTTEEYEAFSAAFNAATKA